MSYKDISEVLDLSESGIKRAFSNKTLNLIKVEKICNFLGISLYELVQQSEANFAPSVKNLSMQQEKILAGDQVLFVLFYFLLSGLDYKAIIDKTNLEIGTVDEKIALLENIGLVEIDTKKQIKILSVKNPVWIEGGPLNTAYENRLVHEAALEHDFTKTGYRRFLFGNLDIKQLSNIEEKLRKIEVEFMQACKNPSKETSMHAIYHSMLPWNFSLFKSYLK